MWVKCGNHEAVLCGAGPKLVREKLFEPTLSTDTGTLHILTNDPVAQAYYAGGSSLVNLSQLMQPETNSLTLRKSPMKAEHFLQD